MWSFSSRGIRSQLACCQTKYLSEFGFEPICVEHEIFLEVFFIASALPEHLRCGDYNFYSNHKVNSIAKYGCQRRRQSDREKPQPISHGIAETAKPKEKKGWRSINQCRLEEFEPQESGGLFLRHGVALKKCLLPLLAKRSRKEAPAGATHKRTAVTAPRCYAGTLIQHPY